MRAGAAGERRLAGAAPDTSWRRCISLNRDTLSCVELPFRLDPQYLFAKLCRIQFLVQATEKDQILRESCYSLDDDQHLAPVRQEGIMSIKDPIGIVGSDRIFQTELIVDFSDNTSATFTAEQLSEMGNERFSSDETVLKVEKPLLKR